MDPNTSQSGSFSISTARTIATVSASSPRAKSTSAATNQNLSSILNNPHAPDTSPWWSSALPAPEFSPIASAKSSTDISISVFKPYLSLISNPYSHFEDIIKHSKKENVDFEAGGHGEALAACLGEVPALYFSEDFTLEDGSTFRAACLFSSFSDNIILQEKLSQYLDVVEMHLMREISLRSDSFFEAQCQLEDLSWRIVEGCRRIREIRETVRLLEGGLVDTARRIQELNGSRGDLLVLQQKLRLIFYVNQAISALKLLIASGDCSGALDVTDDLQNLLKGEELTGLHCFRHIRDHVAAAIDDINSILSAEFMRISVHDTGNTDEVILSKAKARLLRYGVNSDVKLDEQDTSSFRDQFLPVTIGLLRTAKLPSVLRMYRDSVTVDMKRAIKAAVADLLPVLLSTPIESDLVPGDRTVDTDGGGSSLASKLRSLSSESFVQLLEAIFDIIMSHLGRASEVKRTTEWIICNIEGHYAAHSVASAIAFGSAASDAAKETGGQADSVMPYSSPKKGLKMPSIPIEANDSTFTSNVSKNFRADVLRENTEAIFAACDIAHGRWAKLLGVRAIVHPRLRLREFLSIYNVTQELIAATEKIGGRLGYSIRGTLQSQAKAFVDFQHESRMAKIKAVLDQETWTEVDVPYEFQAIVTSFFCNPKSLRDEQKDNNAISDNVAALSNNSPLMADTGLANSHKRILQLSLEASIDENTRMETFPSPRRARHRKSYSVDSLPQNNSTNSKERRNFSSQTLEFEGLGYHTVNCGLILLKMLSEYIVMNNNLPVLSSEVVHRVVELLKFFNTRTCQLVLGAGAMQVSGLKSITSKHLALASQLISFTYAIIPEIRRILFVKVPETRKAMLLSEIDRVAQDYKVHRDEIHTKLVQIMRERLLFHLRSLPQIVEGWNSIEDSDSQPSQFARSLTKEVGYLQRVLSRTLHEVDVQAIFRQVVIIFHSQISEAFSQLDISTQQAENSLRRDVEHILGCIHSLPSDSPSKTDTPNWGKLDEFLG